MKTDVQRILQIDDSKDKLNVLIDHGLVDCQGFVCVMLMEGERAAMVHYNLDRFQLFGLLSAAETSLVGRIDSDKEGMI